jgi:hypothetical protein
VGLRHNNKTKQNRRDKSQLLSMLSDD